MKLNMTEASVAVEIAIEAGVNLNLIGLSGIGKTSIVGQAVENIQKRIEAEDASLSFTTHPSILRAKAQNKPTVSLTECRLAYMTSSDNFGIPDKVRETYKDANGNEETDLYHTYTRPSFWPRSDLPGLHVLFLDELNRGTKLAINCIMEATQEKRMRGYPAPELTRFIAANNPPIGDYHVNTLGEALLARFCHVHVVADVDTFLSNRISKLDQITISNLVNNKNEESILYKPVNDEFDIEEMVSWCPRIREEWSKIVALMESKGKAWVNENSKVLKTMSIGLIGVENSRKWWDEYSSGTLISPSDLLNDTEVYERLKDKGPTALFLSSYILKKITSDMLDSKNKKNQLTNLSNFIEKLSSDYPDLVASVVKHYTSSLSNDKYKELSSYILKRPWLLKYIKEQRQISAKS